MTIRRFKVVTAIKILLAAMALGSYSTINNAIKSSNWVWAIEEVIVRINNVQIAIADCQIAAKSFVITHNTEYLKNYESRLEQIPTLMEEISRHVKHDTKQVQLLGELDAVITEKVDFMETYVALAEMGDYNEAVNLLVSNRGEVIMKEVRRTSMKMINHEKLKRDEQIRSSEWWSTLALTIIPFLFIAAIVVMIYVDTKEP